MRAFVPALALALLATPALAQTPAPLDAPAPAAPPQAMPAPPRPQAQRPRGGFAQRFDAANTTHDGRLTLAQARTARLAVVVRNFAAIDKDGKGYVTRRDIADFARARRAQRPAPAQQPATQAP